MCKDCVKTIFPQRETLCTETGVYIQNFAGCSKCNEQNRAPDSLISKGKFFVMSMSKLDKKPFQNKANTYSTALIIKIVFSAKVDRFRKSTI